MIRGALLGGIALLALLFLQRWWQAARAESAPRRPARAPAGHKAR